MLHQACQPPSSGALPSTRTNLLNAAIEVFAQSGFTGGRVEHISRTAGSHDRMIYYYFGSKEGLFVAALEEIYRRFNEAESALTLDRSDPELALAQIIRFSLNYYRTHPEFIRLLNSENLHQGRHIVRSARAGTFSTAAVSVLDSVLQAGQARGLFRSDVQARDLYLTIAALGYFYLSNQYTLSAFLGESLANPGALQHWEGHMVDTVRRSLRPD